MIHISKSIQFRCSSLFSLILKSIVILFLIQGCTAKNKDKISSIKADSYVTEAASGIFTDPRDGQSYTYETMKDGKKWMTQNLNYNTHNSWCYEEMESHCQKRNRGKLYTWEAALQACPKGWQLPTIEEWQVMTKHYGGFQDYPIKKSGQAAFNALFLNEGSNFSATMAGVRSIQGNYSRLNEQGFYWSTTGSNFDTKTAGGVFFYGGISALCEGYYNKKVARSCRCIQD